MEEEKPMPNENDRQRERQNQQGEGGNQRQRQQEQEGGNQRQQGGGGSQREREREREFRPAVDRGSRPFAEKAAPGGDRAWLARRERRDEPLLGRAHSAANRVSAPPKSTDTSRLTPFSIIVTP